MELFDSLAPTVIGQGDKGASGGASSQASPPQDSQSLQKKAQENLKVDESQPLTSIQVRDQDYLTVLLILKGKSHYISH